MDKIARILIGVSLAGFWILGGVAIVFGQSSPNLIPGQVPTAAQWNSYFAKKWDYPGYSAVNKNGDVMLGLLRFNSAVPSLTSCGTSPSISGSNQVGQVTMGTGSPTGCTITFGTANPWSAAPSCTVTWQSNLAAMGYTVTQSTLLVTQTATSSNKINYACWGLQ
jgi:hypothetical protein